MRVVITTSLIAREVLANIQALRTGRPMRKEGLREYYPIPTPTPIADGAAFFYIGKESLGLDLDTFSELYLSHPIRLLASDLPSVLSGEDHNPKIPVGVEAAAVERYCGLTIRVLSDWYPAGVDSPPWDWTELRKWYNIHTDEIQFRPCARCLRLDVWA